MRLRICKYDLFRRLWLYVYLAIVGVGYIFQPVRVLHEICSAKFVGRYNPKAKKGDDSMGIMYMQPSYIQILIAEGQKRSIWPQILRHSRSKFSFEGQWTFSPLGLQGSSHQARACAIAYLGFCRFRLDDSFAGGLRPLIPGSPISFAFMLDLRSIEVLLLLVSAAIGSEMLEPEIAA